MTGSNPPAILIADAIALDFLNSRAKPVHEEVEWLSNGDGLVQWLLEARLVQSDRLELVQNSVVPGELDSIASQARSMREWFRTFVENHKGKPLSADAIAELEPLNRLLARDRQFAQIQATNQDEGRRLRLEMRREWKSPEALLAPIAEAIGRFVCTEEFTDIKHCEGHDCTLIFIDRTRGKKRRWCSMAICGNRAKQAAHRARIGNNAGEFHK